MVKKKSLDVGFFEIGLIPDLPSRYFDKGLFLGKVLLSHRSFQKPIAISPGLLAVF